MTTGYPARSIAGLLLALLTLVAGCAHAPPIPDRPPPRPTPSTTPEGEGARPATPGELPTRVPIVEPAPLFALREQASVSPLPPSPPRWWWWIASGLRGESAELLTRLIEQVVQLG